MNLQSNWVRKGSILATAIVAVPIFWIGYTYSDVMMMYLAQIFTMVAFIFSLEYFLLHRPVEQQFRIVFILFGSFTTTLIYVFLLVIFVGSKMTILLGVWPSFFMTFAPGLIVGAFIGDRIGKHFHYIPVYW